MTFGERLRELRSARKLTLRSLSERVGVGILVGESVAGSRKTVRVRSSAYSSTSRRAVRFRVDCVGFPKMFC